MSRGVYVALSGALAQEAVVETTAANVANASTPGFRRARPLFRETLAEAVSADRSLRYVAVDKTSLDTTPGALRATDRPLDVALPRGGFLVVTTPRGERYTRAGSLSLDPEGQLRAAGLPVATEGGAGIKVDKAGAPLSVDADGSVRQGASVVGKLKLVSFEGAEGMIAEGGRVLAQGSASEPRAGAGGPLVVGALEESNAEPVVAMTELMGATRTFEAFQRALDAFGEIDRKLVTTVAGAFEP